MGKGTRPPAGQSRKAPPPLTPEEFAGERWREVADWPGYEVSDLGRLRSWKRQKGQGRGLGPIYVVDYSHPPRLLSGWIAEAGHRRAILTEKPYRQASPFFHVLVLEAFVGPAPPGKQGAHRDGVPANNRLSNLRWATPKENTHDKHAHGTFPAGEMVPTARLSLEQVAEIRSAYLTGSGVSDLARKYGVTKSAVSNVVRGNNWRDGYVPPPARPQRKLTSEDVKTIRAKLDAGARGNALAQRYGVHAAVISNIRLGKSYRDV